MATDSISKGGGNGGNAGDTHEEDAIEHRSLNTDIGNLPGSRTEEALLSLWLSIKIDEQSA